jgi:hypothetical protein
MYTDGFAQLLGTSVADLTYSEDAGGNVFVDRMPSSPDRAVCIYATPGAEADSRMPYDPATFQIVVRSEADGVWAAAIWQEIYSVLHALRYVTLPDGTYLAWCIAIQSSPFRLGDDENGRPSYSGNYRTEIINPTAERPE